MIQRTKTTLGRTLIAGVSAIAILTVGAAIETKTDYGFGSVDAAAQQGGQGQGGQGQGGQGQGGQGGGGHSDGGHDDGGDDHGSGGQGGQGSGGQGPRAGSGEPDDSDGKGPQAGKPAEGSGGKPAWAQEGIPEVELGRLNVARSPDHVLERALNEVLNNFDPAASASLYGMTAAQFAAYVEANWDTVTIIDSPLENLALLDEFWNTGSTSLPGVTPASTADLSGILLGAASDKNVPVSTDTVSALATIMGVSMSDATINSIAAKAEDVRLAILAGHG
jgi:hypothetical protein